MKQIILQKMEQHGVTCYIGKIDPRELVKVATKVEMSVVQDAQRPLNEKRVKDIAKYVDNPQGILPSTLTLASCDSRFVVYPKEEALNVYYTMFPETDAEFLNFVDAIVVMDGQHRLYSFGEELRLLPDNEKFEIGFTLYIMPTLVERQQIFISCNEKQEKVSGNLLMWFKEQLGMLTTDEKKFFPIVSRLNNEYPLKGHIIMSAEKVKNGIKANYMIKIMRQAGIQNMQSRGMPLSENDIVKVVCLYLSAWEKVVGFSFSMSTARQAGPAIKGAGLNYMIQLLPTFWNRARTLQKKFDMTFIENTIVSLISSWGVLQKEYFTCEENLYKFRDRTGIDKFVQNSIAKINGLDAEEFDPLG